MENNIYIYRSGWFTRVYVGQAVFGVNGIFRCIIPISVTNPNPSLHGHIRIIHFLLPFTSFVVLKPIKDILPFNLGVLSESS